MTECPKCTRNAYTNKQSHLVGTSYTVVRRVKWCHWCIVIHRNAHCTLSRSNWPNNEKKTLNNPLLRAQSQHQASILLNYSLPFFATFTHFCVIFSGLHAECILFVWPIGLNNFRLHRQFLFFISPNHLHTTPWITHTHINCILCTLHTIAFSKSPPSTTRWWRIFAQCTEMKIRLNAFWKCIQRFIYIVRRREKKIRSSQTQKLGANGCVVCCQFGVRIYRWSKKIPWWLRRSEWVYC